MSGKVYFFKGNQYIQLDAGTKTIDPGYPRPIAKDWNGLQQLGFDQDLNAAAYVPSQQALFFFKGNNYAKYNLLADKVVDNGAIDNFFKDIPPGFHNSPTGVSLFGPGELDFFQEEYNVFCNAAVLPGTSWSGLYKTTARWGLSARYSSLDATLWFGPENTVYFFKDAHLSTYGGSHNDVLISSVWQGVSTCGFDQGIQAAVYLDPGRKPVVPETNVLAVIDTKSVKDQYALKMSTDPNNPTLLASKNVNVGYLLVTVPNGKNVSSAEASLNLNFSADLYDQVSFRGVSIDGNSEDAVVIYNIAHVSGDTVFTPFIPHLKTRSKAAVPDPNTDNGLPALSAPINFSSFDSEVAGTGTENAYIDFAIYQLSSDCESQDLVGYGRLASAITIRAA